MKWAQNPEPIRHENFDTLVISLEPDDVEVMQSSEIIYRELRARGHRVLFDDRNLPVSEKRVDFPRFKNAVLIEIGREGLSKDGSVKLTSLASSLSEWVRLEDAVEKLEEFKNAIGRI